MTDGSLVKTPVKDRAQHHKKIYLILSLRLMGWARRHSGFDKYKLGLPNVRHTATK